MDFQLAFRGLDLLLQLAQLAITQAGRLLQVGLPFGALDLQARLLDLLLEAAQFRDGLFLGLPARRDSFGLFAQVRQFLLDVLQPFLGSLVLFLLERLALDLELHDLPVHLIQCLRFGIDLGAQARGRLVDQVDGLIGQVAIADVAL